MFPGVACEQVGGGGVGGETLTPAGVVETCSSRQNTGPMLRLRKQGLDQLSRFNQSLAHQHTLFICLFGMITNQRTAHPSTVMTVP